MKKTKTTHSLKSLLFEKKFIVPAAIILFLFFLTRLINLTNIPVFVDEAIYVRWSQVMRAEPTLRFLPLSDGKQPLFMWLTIPFLKLFSNPLFAGRVTSTMAGLGTLLGVGALSWYLFRSRFTVLLATLLYVLVPYTLFFDRMALVDSLLSMFGIWSLLLGIWFVRTPRLDLSMLLGFALGGALLTKSPGILFVLLQPVLLLTTSRFSGKKITQIIGGWVVAGVIALALFNLMRLGPNFQMLNSRNQDYIFSFSEVLTHPFNPLTGNTKSTISWTVSLFTWPIALALVFSPFINKKRRFVVTLLFWSLLPLLFQASIAKVYTPRYLLYAMPPLLVLASFFLSTIQKRFKKTHAALTVVFLAIIFPSIKSYQVIFNPENARLPLRMRNGYFQEWTAGYGQAEIAQYIRERSKEANIIVATEGFFGTLPDGLQIYLEKVPNVVVLGVGQPISGISQSLVDALEENEVYLVVNKSRNLLANGQENRVELINSWDKPPRTDGTHETLQFFRVLH